MMDRRLCGILLTTLLPAAAAWAALSPGKGPGSEHAAFELLKARCVRCHGPARQEGGLNLAVPAGLVRGGKSGPAVRRPGADGSLLWRRVAAGQMPPGEPLSASERAVLRTWLAAGAPGLPASAPARAAGDEHWASLPLQSPTPPRVRDGSRVRGPIDRFIQARLEEAGLTLGAEAPREVLIRRVAFDLTGLPPTPQEIRQFLADRSPLAYEAMVDRYLASPRFGERWGKYWLDAAGYADSNGYFNADTDRPLAYRYRDYVVRSLNADKPWDQFLREQLAGDELVGYHAGAEIRPGMVEALEATHFLRNSQDGTDSSDGNPDERRADKYAVLEGEQQIIGSALLGITVQCARCHDHKFEPFTQKDYYGLQAVLYPAFNVESWVTPGKREMNSATPAEVAAWEAERARIEREIAAKRREWTEFARQHREAGKVMFEAAFDGPEARLGGEWSNAAPGDASPAGTPPVQVDSPAAPGAQVVRGRLRIRESGSAGDRALSTKQVFDWTPDGKGSWIQASFDLVADGDPAPYVGYFVALRDFARGGVGNVLLDGARAGQAAVHVGYPARPAGRGKIGRSGYEPGRSYGVRITNIGEGKWELAQVVDGVPEEGTVQLSGADLPDGGFGFEYCCGRSFTVDNVRIEAGGSDPQAQGQREAFARKRTQIEAAVKQLEASRPERPGRLAAVTDLSPEPPKVPLLFRGDYKSPRDSVDASAPGVLSEPSNPAALTRPAEVKGTTGRRLAFARWLTRPGSRAAARLARVTVNRWWMHLFGTGIVATPENLGYSGAPPTHPELLEYLAGRLAQGGWRTKALLREVLLSGVYRQSSVPTAAARQRDEDNRLLSHFPLRRLDAEAVRDAMLAASGELDSRMGGPYIPTARNAEGEVVVAESTPGARRRSLYLQQRRTQVTGLLATFDAPSIVTNCTFRTPTTVPLQSLALLNSEFVRARSAAMARRLLDDRSVDEAGRIRAAFVLTRAVPPNPAETGAAETFLKEQAAEYGGDAGRAWTDFCQSLLAGNAFLYVR